MTDATTKLRLKSPGVLVLLSPFGNDATCLVQHPKPFAESVTSNQAYINDICHKPFTDIASVLSSLNRPIHLNCRAKSLSCRSNPTANNEIIEASKSQLSRAKKGLEPRSTMQAAYAPRGLQTVWKFDPSAAACWMPNRQSSVGL